MPLTKGAQVAIKAVMMGAQMGLAMMNKIEGPRLEDLSVTTADFGTPLNYFWGTKRLEGRPIIWAEPLREKKSTSKGKSGKYAEYKYFGTFAVVIADHEIDSVTRIWMDKHLVYDVTRAGPISPVLGLFSSIASGSPVKLTAGRNMRIYLGTETQEPDPRMEAWCEDRYGADSCPAYRGVSYIVFQDLPLEKFGNRIPQVTVEAVNVSAPNYLFETITPGASLGPWFSPDGSRALWHNSINTSYAIWDVPSRTKIIQGNLADDCDEAIIGADGRIYGVGGTLGAETLRIFSADGQSHISNVDIGTFGDRLTSLGSNLYMRPYSGAGTSIISCNTALCEVIDVDFTPEMFFEDLDGGHWAIALSGTDVILYGINTGTEFTVATPGGVTGPCSGMVNDDGDFFVIVDTTAMIIDFATGTLVDSADIGGNSADHFEVMRRMRPGSASFFGRLREVDTNTLATVQTYSLSSWTGSDTSIQAYEPITHSLWTRTGTIRYLDRVSSDGVDLADVITDVANRCGVVEFDVSGLTQVIAGYSVVQGPGKDWISPLLDIHDVDARPHDFAVQFLTRGSAVSGTIPVTEFVREDDEPRYSVTIKQDTDLPKKLSLSFADSDKDQQKNTVIAQRPSASTDGERELTIDLSTYVGTPGDIQKQADRYFRRQWNGREGVNNALTAQYLGIEPADVWSLQLDSVTQSHKVTKMTLGQGRISFEWERDFPALHNLGTGTGAAMEGRDDDEIYVSGQAKGVVADIPFLRDSHAASSPLLNFAAGKYAGNFPGAVIWNGDFAEDVFDQWNAVDSSSGAVWGYAETALGSADPWLWDRGNSIVIQLKGGTLTSVTEAEINADPTLNQALIGNQGRWEIVNFTTATLLGDGRWQVSGFRRGRRGTEWAVPLHAAGDEFWLAEDLAQDSYGLSDVGTEELFKTQTLGRDPTEAPTIEVELEGASLKPYAPANLSATRDLSNGNWTITGRRRTRVGGAWVGGTSIPLSEASEAYEVVILDNDDNEVRELTVTADGDGNFSASYSTSDQATDFGSLQTLIRVAAYQVSDAVGRGFPATLDASASGVIPIGSITAGGVRAAANAGVTPHNPAHTSGDTLLCVVMCRGTAISASCATTGWTAADGVTNPASMNGCRMWLFQNECDSDSEASPAISVSGGSSSDTVVAVVLRIPGRNPAANFVLGTVSANAVSNIISFAQDSPSIDNGNAIIAIGVQPENYSDPPGVIQGVTAGLDWTELVDFTTTLGSDLTLTVDYALNDSGAAYTAGTGGFKNPDFANVISAGVYLEVPLL